MEHEFLQLELILWIGVLIIVFLGFLVIYMKYKSDKTKYLMGIALFFALFFIARICSFVNYYILGFKGDIYLFDDLFVHPEWFWLQFGYNEFSYGGAFILYFVLERYVIKTKYFFSVCTVIIAVLSSLNYLIIMDLTTIQVPFYLIVLLGLPSIYLYLAIKSSGNIRLNSSIICIGILIYEIGMALSIPEAQMLLWSNFMPCLVYEICGPLFQIIGGIIMINGFVRIK
ncbi:MAG: hypothetical protein ACTSXT_08700 [Candidatus Helarchaeota archaeon]